MERKPNFENLRRTLLRQGLPDYVPLVEFSVDRDVKAAFLGRPVESLRDEVEFWVRAGYDFVPLQAGIRSLIRPGLSAGARTAATPRQREGRAAYSVYSTEDRTITWAEEGRGVITSLEEFERFPWPDPEEMNLTAFEEVGRYLPPGMKVIAYMGWTFTAVWTLMGMETFCYALYEQPELIRRMYDRVWWIQSRVLLRVLEFDVAPGITATSSPVRVSVVPLELRHGPRARPAQHLSFRWTAHAGARGHPRLRLRCPASHRTQGHGHRRAETPGGRSALLDRQH